MLWDGYWDMPFWSSNMRTLSPVESVPDEEWDSDYEPTEAELQFEFDAFAGDEQCWSV